jgi:hypothetical protein
MASEARGPSEPAAPVVRRARRRAATTMVGGTLVVALVVAGSVAALSAVREWNRSTPLASVPPPTPTSSPVVTGRFDELDLRDLVLRTEERPRGYGLEHDPTYSEFESARTVASTLAIPTAELERTGFVTAYVNGFLSPNWSDASVPGSRIDLISYAILFPDADAARSGFRLVAGGPTEALRLDGWRSEPVPGLGEQAVASTGTLDGLATVSYAWQVDNVVLFIASQGGATTVDPDTVLSLAEQMDARAA